eukprot:7389979-Prymnesium_polylepis.1
MEEGARRERGLAATQERGVPGGIIEGEDVRRVDGTVDRAIGRDVRVGAEAHDGEARAHAVEQGGVRPEGGLGQGRHEGDIELARDRAD